MKPLFLLIPVLAALAFFLMRHPEGNTGPESLAPEEQALALAENNPIQAELASGTQVEAVTSGTRNAAPAVDQAGAVPDADQGTWEKQLSGRVVTTAGAPLSQAKVRLIRGSDQESGIVIFGQQDKTLNEASSGSDGRFELGQPKGSKGNQVVVELPGYQTLRTTIEADNLGDLVLDQGLIVRGTVLDFGGDPVAGAQVMRTGDSGSSPVAAFVMEASSDHEIPASTFGRVVATTDEQGRFELAHERPGDIQLQVNHPQHPKHTHTTSGQVGDTLDETIGLAKSATLRGRLEGLDETSTREIRVLAERKEDKPSSSHGALFSLGNRAERRAKLEADGTFAISGLHADETYTVWATENKTSHWDAEACSERVVVNASDSGVTLRYETGAKLLFTVVDAKTGEPIEELDVRHNWQSPEGMNFSSSMGLNAAKTYPAGKVEIDALRPENPPAILELKVGAPGYQTEELTPSIPAEGKVSLGMVRLAPTATLRVHVATADGKPVEGAKVNLSGGSSSRPGMPGGGSEGGTVVRSMSFSVSSSDDSEAAPDIDDILAGRSGESAHAVTDAEGMCELALPDDSVGKLSVTAEDLAPHTEEDLALPMGGIMEHSVVMSAGGKVNLQVLNSDGSPASRARVEQHGVRKKHRADSEGRITLDLVSPGVHHFRVAEEAAGGVGMVFVASFGEEEDLSDWLALNVAEGQVSEGTLTLMPSGNLTGTVLAQGEPVQKARLKLTLVDESMSDQERALQEAMDSLGGLNLAGGGSLTDKTDRNGRFEIESADIGLYTLRVSHPDWAMPQETEVRIQEGANTLEVDLDLCIVTGRVLDTNGDPVAGATVSASEASDSPNQMRIGLSINGAMGTSGPGTVTTDSDGQYELRGVAQGKLLTIKAEANGLAPTESAQPKLLANEVRNNVDLVLESGATLTVELEGSETLTGMVMARPESGQPKVQQASDGKVVFSGMTPGTWTVSKLSMGQAPGTEVSEEVTLKSGDNKTIILDGEDD